MVILWWSSVSQVTAAALLGVVFIYWFVGVVSRREKLDKAILGDSVLLGFFY